MTFCPSRELSPEALPQEIFHRRSADYSRGILPKKDAPTQTTVSLDLFDLAHLPLIINPQPDNLGLNPHDFTVFMALRICVSCVSLSVELPAQS